MRNKNDSVKIKHLHHVFASPLIAFDVMHYEMTGEEAVITSGNDGKHMEGSKHYTNEAVDIRRWAYDKLLSSQQEDFSYHCWQIFPPDRFDFIEEADHFHIEYDPKPIRQRIKAGFLNRKPRRTIKAVKHVFPILKDKVLLKKLRKKNGFKRIAGIVIGVGALIVKAVAPEFGVVVDIVGLGGGALFGIGGADALKKNREKDSDTYVDKNKYLRIIADIIIKLLRQFFKKKGK